MAKLTDRQKALRVTEFLHGMSFPGVTRSLARRGFDAAELAEGWRLVQDLTADAFEAVAVTDDTPTLLAQLDAWENEWFSVASICLRARYPEVQAWLFGRLEQTKGADVAVTVPLFVKRLAELDTVPDGPKARALLERRGLTSEVVAVARKLSARVRSLPDIGPTVDVDPDVRRAERVTAMWTWYLEWSAIARGVIRERRQLRALGFARGASTTNSEE